MAWKKRAYATLGKISFVICLIYVIGATIWYSFFDRANSDLGTYYVYTLDNSNAVRKAPIFWRGRDCDLILNYDSINEHYSHIRKHLNLIEDTIMVSFLLPVQLINYECDSLVAVIRFPNKMHDPTMKSSNVINPEFLEGLISFKNLNKSSPDSTKWGDPKANY